MPISEYLRNLREKIGHDQVLMPGVAAVIRNTSGEVLLQRRYDNGVWELPGGAIDPGEHPADSVVREVYEETGLHVIPERIVGVYTEPPVYYPNGDAVSYIVILFECAVISGFLQAVDGEAAEISFFSLESLPSTLNAWHVTYISHAIDQAIDHKTTNNLKIGNNTLENNTMTRFNFSLKSLRSDSASTGGQNTSDNNSEKNISENSENNSYLTT